MRFTIFFLIALTSFGCQQSGDRGATGPVGAAGISISSVWEYNDIDTCAGADFFGDTNAGCIRFIQLIKYSDGSSYVSTVVGQNFGAADWSTISFFLKPTTTTFSKSFFSDSGTGSYTFSGDVSLATPTFAANHDNNGNLSDTIAKSFTMAQQ